MPPPPQGTATPKASPLSALTREELGWAWARVLRELAPERRTRRAGGTLAWIRHPTVTAFRDEFRLRHLDALDEVERVLVMAERDWPYDAPGF